MNGADVVRVVRGQPSSDELAAVIAVVLARAGRDRERTAYEAWRAGRLAALRSDPRRPARPAPAAFPR